MDKADKAFKEPATLKPTLEWIFHEREVVGEACYIITSGDVKRRKK